MNEVYVYVLAGTRINGRFCRPGDITPLPMSDFRGLAQRQRVRLPTEEELEAAGLAPDSEEPVADEAQS